jgi:hypothetical protein
MRDKIVVLYSRCYSFRAGAEPIADDISYKLYAICYMATMRYAIRLCIADKNKIYREIAK